MLVLTCYITFCKRLFTSSFSLWVVWMDTIPKKEGKHTFTFGIWDSYEQKNSLVDPIKLEVNVISKESTSTKKSRIADFVDETKDPQYYIDRYNNESSYKKWFHDNYPQYDSIEQAVGLELTQKIPSWIKSIFGLYAQDKISEDELLNTIQYLIDEGILVVNR